MNYKNIPVILPHEHPLSARSNLKSVFKLLLDFKNFGGFAVVDVTPETPHLCRDPLILLSLAEKINLHVYFSTGYYKDPYLSTLFSPRSSEYEIAQKMLREIEEGIKGSKIRPTLIGEVGTSFKQITSLEKKALLAAAIVHKQTGLPIITHTTHGTMGLEQLDILEKAGADLERIVVGHCDLNNELEYLIAIARRGAFLGFDTIGKEKWFSPYGPKGIATQPDYKRIKLLIALCEKGFVNKILLSMDMLKDELDLNLQTHKKYGYVYIYVFVDKLRKLGFSDEECATLLWRNPYKLLMRSDL